MPRAPAPFLLLLLAPIQGCGAGEELVAPTSATLEVVTATVNPPAGVDGYTVLVDGVAHDVGLADTLTVSGLSVATHEVRLTGLPEGCATEGTNPQFVALPPDATISLPFQVLCPTPVVPATLAVTIVTIGSAPDADGYSLLVDEQAGRPVGVNQELALTDLTPGNHHLRLADVASNCEVRDANPRVIDVPQVLETDFEVTCLPPLTGDIAYDSGRGDTDDADFEFNTDIYLRDVNGTSLRNLTNTPFENEREPLWSPDGRQLLFTLFADEPSFFVMDADNFQRRPLAGVPPSASGLQWSPDGSRLLFVSQTSEFEDEVDIYDVGTDQLQAVVSLTDSRRVTGLCWSPDGSRVAYSTRHFGTVPSTNVVNTVGAGGGTPVLIATASGRTQSVQAWSPDGSTIAFVQTDTDGRDDIYLVPADGSGAPINLTSRPGSYREVTWSPDGQLLAFSNDELPNEGLYTITLTGTQRRLTTEDAEDISWSKDGSRLLFEESLEIYVINFDGTGRRTITADDELNDAPSWRP